MNSILSSFITRSPNITEGTTKRGSPEEWSNEAEPVTELEGGLTHEQERPQTEVHNLLEVDDQRVVRSVQGVGLDTERRAGHDVQAVWRHQSAAEGTGEVVSPFKDGTWIHSYHAHWFPDTTCDRVNHVLFDIDHLILVLLSQFLDEPVGIATHDGIDLHRKKGCVMFGWETSTYIIYSDLIYWPVSVVRWWNRETTKSGSVSTVHLSRLWSRRASLPTYCFPVNTRKLWISLHLESAILSVCGCKRVLSSTKQHTCPTFSNENHMTPMWWQQITQI